MAGLPIKPLDGPGGYLRWKESLLLRAHSLGVARVLLEAGPGAAGDAYGPDDEAAANAKKKWARDDAVCRGHILAALSDRLLPDYARFGTAAELWRALERTYDVQVPDEWWRRFNEFGFDRSAAGDVLLEQIAHAEALGAAAGLSDGDVARAVSRKLPLVMLGAVEPGPDGKWGMGRVWEAARGRVSADAADPRYLWGTPTPEMEDEDCYYLEGEGEGCYVDVDGPKPELQNTAGRKRGMSGQAAGNSRRRA